MQNARNATNQSLCFGDAHNDPNNEILITDDSNQRISITTRLA